MVRWNSRGALKKLKTKYGLDDFANTFIDQMGARYWELVLKTPIVRETLNKALRAQSFSQIKFYEKGPVPGWFNHHTRELHLVKELSNKQPLGFNVATLAHELTHSLQYLELPLTEDRLIEAEAEAYGVTFQALCQLPKSSHRCENKIEEKATKSHIKNYRRGGRQYAHDWAEFLVLKQRGTEEGKKLQEYVDGY